MNIIKKFFVMVISLTIMMSFNFTTLSVSAQDSVEDDKNHFGEIIEEIFPIQEIEERIEKKRKIEEIKDLKELKKIEMITAKTGCLAGYSKDTIMKPLKLGNIKEKYINTISYDMDVTKLSGFTLEEFKILMEGITADDENDFYTVNAETIYNLSHKYKLNEIFFCGLISTESWWGTADNCVAKNNYTGIMCSSGLIYYDSVEENLEATASNLHNNYLSDDGRYNNGRTMAGIAVCYCDSSWPDVVWSRMSQIFY